jgi:hypothetical protein
MEVDTLGVARSLGWKVHMRCADGYRESTKSMRRCVYRKQLDLETLVSTRGQNFPLSRLESRLMCPACGNRRVTVVFEPRRAMRRWEGHDWKSSGGGHFSDLDVDDSVSLIGRNLCANDFEGEVIC